RRSIRCSYSGARRAPCHGRGQAYCDQGRICELAGDACFGRFRLADVFDPRLPGPAGARTATGDERLSRLAVTAMTLASKPGWLLVARRTGAGRGRRDPERQPAGLEPGMTIW